ncbi:MAG: amidohydrolase, partial [Microbacterium sp.]
MDLHESAFALDNAHVVPIEGNPFDGRLLVRDGRIVDLGPRIDVPAEVPLVPLDGAWVLPGFVDVHTHLGAAMQDVGPHDADINERALSNAAGMRAIDSVNPADTAFDDAVAAGVTTVCVMPGSLSPIGGQAVTLHTWGDVVDDMVLESAPALKMAMGENAKREHALRNQVPVTRMGIAHTIRTALQAAREYAEQRATAEAAGLTFRTDPSLEPLAEVLAGRRRVRQ